MGYHFFGNFVAYGAKVYIDPMHVSLIKVIRYGP